MQNHACLRWSLLLCLTASSWGVGVSTASEQEDARARGLISCLGVKRRADPLQLLVMAFSPDGTLLACAGIRGEEGHPEYRPFPIWLLDGRTAEPKGILKGHDGHVAGLHFSPSGKELASDGLDDVVCV